MLVSASNSVHQCLFVCLAAGTMMRAAANGQFFLGSRDQHLSLHSHHVSDLLSELGRVVGQDQRQATERRIDRLEDALRPMFKAMPKDRSGRLSAVSVRYVLHRLFVQRHGWLMIGLQNDGDNWNSSSPTEIFKSTAGDEVHKVFDETLSSMGFTLHQVAVFAATLENLVHNDNIERLQVAYRMMGVSPEQANLSEDKAYKVIKAYMMMYVLSLDHGSLRQPQFEEASEAILSIYPTWPDTEMFAQEVRDSVLADVPQSERTSWNSTLRVLEEVGERYGKWQNKECHDLKKTLVGMEDPGTGRVPLTRFYKSALENISWQFMESVPYLRQLGALDETDPERKSVLITNYVYSPSNCVASSKFYSVCCIDECEELLGSLEKVIAASEATPTRILAEVSALGSNTVQAPRELPWLLKERLKEISAYHGGYVPLHGRLFAQWLHHAYPLECPYPHLSGTTKPVTALDYIQKTGASTEATHEEIADILNKSSTTRAHGIAQDVEARPELPWSSEEELFVCHQEKSEMDRNGNEVLSAFRGIAPVVAALSMAFVFVRLHESKQKSTTVDQKVYV